MLSIIVGTKERPEHLRTFLQHLKLQTNKDFEVIVADEGRNGDIALEFSVKHYMYPFRGDWHQTAKARAAQHAKGEYLCFPNDDAYYAPTFVEEMTGADLVYCDWVWDQDNYRAQTAKPVVGRIDVGGFVIKKSVFESVGWNDRGPEGDGKLVEEVARNYTTLHVPKVLYVKN